MELVESINTLLLDPFDFYRWVFFEYISIAKTKHKLNRKKKIKQPKSKYLAFPLLGVPSKNSRNSRSSSGNSMKTNKRPSRILRKILALAARPPVRVSSWTAATR